MAIAVDATGTLKVGTSNVTSVDYTGITVGSGLADGALVCWVVWACPTSTQVSAPSATWNGVPMTLIKFVSAPTDGAGAAALFGIVNPDAGNNSLSISWSTNATPVVCAQSYSGVLQTGGITTWPNAVSATGDNVSPSVTVSSAAGHLPIACMCDQHVDSTISSITGTTIWKNTTPSNSCGGVGQTASGASSFTFSCTLNQTAGWEYVAADMVQAAAIPSKPLSRIVYRRR